MRRVYPHSRGPETFLRAHRHRLRGGERHCREIDRPPGRGLSASIQDVRSVPRNGVSRGGRRRRAARGPAPLGRRAAITGRSHAPAGTSSPSRSGDAGHGGRGARPGPCSSWSRRPLRSGPGRWTTRRAHPRARVAARDGGAAGALRDPDGERRLARHRDGARAGLGVARRWSAGPGTRRRGARRERVQDRHGVGAALCGAPRARADVLVRRVPRAAAAQPRERPAPRPGVQHAPRGLRSVVERRLRPPSAGVSDAGPRAAGRAAVGLRRGPALRRPGRGEQPHGPRRHPRLRPHRRGLLEQHAVAVARRAAGPRRRAGRRDAPPVDRGFRSRSPGRGARGGRRAPVASRGEPWGAPSAKARRSTAFTTRREGRSSRA